MLRSMTGIQQDACLARNDLNHSESARQRGRPGGIAYSITLYSGQRSATGASRPRRSSGRTRPTMDPGEVALDEGRLGHRSHMIAHWSRDRAAGPSMHITAATTFRGNGRTLGTQPHYRPRRLGAHRLRRGRSNAICASCFSAAGRALRVLCRSESAAQDRAGPRGRASLPRADWRGGYPRCAPI